MTHHHHAEVDSCPRIDCRLDMIVTILIITLQHTLLGACDTNSVSPGRLVFMITTSDGQFMRLEHNVAQVLQESVQRECTHCHHWGWANWPCPIDAAGQARHPVCGLGQSSSLAKTPSGKTGSCFPLCHALYPHKSIEGILGL